MGSTGPPSSLNNEGCELTMIAPLIKPLSLPLSPPCTVFMCADEQRSITNKNIIQPCISLLSDYAFTGTYLFGFNLPEVFLADILQWRSYCTKREINDTSQQVTVTRHNIPIRSKIQI